MNHRIVVFTTRDLEGGNLFSSAEQSLLEEDSPIVNYFLSSASEDEKGQLNNIPLRDRIKTFLDNNNAWKPEFNSLDCYSILNTVGSRFETDKDFKELLVEYQQSTSSNCAGADTQSSVSFSIILEAIKNVSENTKFKLNIDCYNNDVSLKDRFSLFSLPKEEDKEVCYSVYALWPLARTSSSQDGKWDWVTAIANHFTNKYKEVDSLYIVLHDYDILPKSTFKVIERESSYNEHLKISLMVFQHSSGDPIHSILTKPGLSSKQVYDGLCKLVSRSANMILAAEGDKTAEFYKN